jgi:hypothetical protein
VKLFFLPEAQGDIASRDVFTEEALAGVARALGVDQFETLILSLPGVVLEKDEADYASKDFPVDEKTKQSWIGTWKVWNVMYWQFLTSDLRIALSKRPGV